jgi:hypothetical protein
MSAPQPRHPHAIYIKRDPPRCVEIYLNCGHVVKLNLPPGLHPEPGDVLHCYECSQDVLVKEVRPC